MKGQIVIADVEQSTQDYVIPFKIACLIPENRWTLDHRRIELDAKLTYSLPIPLLVQGEMRTIGEITGLTRDPVTYVWSATGRATVELVGFVLRGLTAVGVGLSCYDEDMLTECDTDDWLDPLATVTCKTLAGKIQEVTLYKFGYSAWPDSRVEIVDG